MLLKHSKIENRACFRMAGRSMVAISTDFMSGRTCDIIHIHLNHISINPVSCVTK